MAHKPASISFDEAAALPQSGIAVLQGLRYEKKIQPGQKILINGAGGGMGSFAVQIAKYYGAEVTGVDSTGKLDMIRSIGADQVIDYTQEDFTKNGVEYDLILDLVCYRSIFHNKRALSSNGVYVMVGGSTARIFQVAFLTPIISKFSSKKMGILGVNPNQKDLNTLVELFETGKVLPVIDKSYTLSEVVDAFRYFSEGNFKGKIIITM